MGATSANFGFLAQHDALLVKLGSLAERYFSDDPNTCLADKSLQLIRRYRNEALPKIAVTVSLLSTGIDIPKISNLVFLRRVRSRILYDQMLGRATRLCPEIGKEVFRIFDAVDLYSALQDYTERSSRGVWIRCSGSCTKLSGGRRDDRTEWKA